MQLKQSFISLCIISEIQAFFAVSKNRLQIDSRSKYESFHGPKTYGYFHQRVEPLPQYQDFHKSHEAPIHQGQIIIQPYSSLQHRDDFKILPLHPLLQNRDEFMTDTSLALKKKCDGKANLISDFGIISLLIGAVSTIVGFSIDLILTVKGTAISVYAFFISIFLAIPNELISILGTTTPFTYVAGNLLNILGIVTTFFGGASVEVGNLGLVTGLFFEFLGIIGLVVSVVASFPELLDDFIDFGTLFGFGDELKLFIDNYGCTNPFENYN